MGTNHTLRQDYMISRIDRIYPVNLANPVILSKEEGGPAGPPQSKRIFGIN
jgi:hypothetical protein